ncbi:hypothetical protein Glove_487g10 [Diversispora epigaea]|uniref:Uncharacterized protein n=1 Tax=Diversispora epigaea TaxID=1348612 RepID=A0A397GS89_9GLOM|nr:hypothetical protein Glove_487g10 [Diversispora epigaea]
MSNCEGNEINENIEIVDFFDNIPENNDDINLFTEIAINKAKKLLNKENEFENIEDTEDTDSEIESIASTIVTKNIDDDDYEIEIPQTAGSHLTSCTLIDKIDGKIQRCGDTKNLRGIVQLIGIWQLDDNAVNEVVLPTVNVRRRGGEEYNDFFLFYNKKAEIKRWVLKYLKMSNCEGNEINENIEIVDFFDNIPENNDDINLFTEIAINKAKKLLNKENEFENIEDTEDTDSEIESIASTIVTKNIDDDDYEIEIPQTAGSHLTSCTLIDKIDGKIQRCGDTKNLRGIVQLIGIWQLDDNAVNEVGKEIENLGVCQQHFMFDQNRLHKKGAKQEQNIINSYLHRRRCRFCGLNFYFFSRGKFCLEHSISIGGKNLLLPCIGHKLCPVLQINEPFTVSAKLQQVSRFLCCDCYEKHDGHLYVRPGRGKVIQECETQGKHNQDTVLTLQLIGKWVINLSNSNNELLKNKILKNITIAIEQSLNTTSDESSFANNNYDNTIPIYKSPRLQIGLNLIKNRKQILQKKQALEEPQSLEEYCSALPVELYNLLNGIIQILFKKKRQAANQVQKSRTGDNNNFQQINIKKIQKIVIFICSIIITIGFKNTKIWLTRMISSLCRKPRLFTNLHDFLVLVSVSGVTRRYERCLETQRMELADLTLRIQQSSNIWNVCVIDNIDFKEKTFTYGNIYDTTRTSSHVTLRLLFQFKLPIEINSISNDEIQLDENTKLFGENSITKEVITIFNYIFIQLLNFHINNDFSIQYSSSYNVEIFNEKIRNHFCNDNLSNYPPAHLVILEAGNNPNNDANINAACEQYFNDLKINNNSKIEVVGDEAIFRRILKYYQNNSRIRPLLGQWHKSKDMCSVLLTIFSGYGIYNMAAVLGVVFLDKLEKIVDYRSTCRILDLIWIAVGSAIHIYIKKKNLNFNNIMDMENNLLKTWFCFYKWTSYWKGHRTGIRTGNNKLQIQCLSAFSPLFPIAVNLTQNGHYFAFDEALETFGVKFIKQNITGNVVDEKNLKRQIKAAQSEKERMNLLLDEFLDDIVLSTTTRAIKELFEMENGTHHPLFQNCNQLTTEGFEKLYRCYQDGIVRLDKIFQQEILCLQAIDTKGRGAKGIVVTKVADLKEKSKKNIKKRTNPFNNPPNENLIQERNELPTFESSEIIPVNEQESPKKIKIARHSPSKEEKDILETLFAYDIRPSDTVIDSALSNLLTYWDGWTKKRLEMHGVMKKEKKRKFQKNKNKLIIDI